jgi:1-acyl-sn-glycerol-3-phosphate acyltransferase
MKSMRIFYNLLWSLAWPFFNLVHPVRHVGREHIPEGAAVVCGNHTSLSDPLFVTFAMGRRYQLRAMAKAEFMRVPVLGWLLAKAGTFGVERGRADVGAIKTAIKFLKGGDKILLFPEGTRVKSGESSAAKTGAAMLAIRTGVPILPVYVPEKKNWFCFTTVVIGEPYYPKVGDKRAGAEDYRLVAEDLMKRIYALRTKIS